MRYLIPIACAFLIYWLTPAQSQTGLTVVAACGTLPLAYAPGAVRTGTQDVNGNACTAAGAAPAGAATAANQVLQITQETAINTILGLQADAACATDNGTCTIAALAKRNNQRLTTIIAGIPVTNAGTFAVQATGTFFQATQPVSQAAGSVASGAYLSGAFASGSMVDLVSLSAPVAPATATATKSALIGCQATSAGINPTTGQQAAADCDLNNNLLVSSGGAPNLTTAQVSVATSDTAVVAARALRRSVTITNVTGTQQVFCSGTTATTGNGQLIPAVVGASWNVSTTAAIRCIALTGAQTVSVSEIY